MKKRVKYKEPSLLVYWTSRIIIGLGLFCAILVVFDFDIKAVVLKCDQVAFCLLTGHLLYIFVEKNVRANIDWETMEKTYILVWFILGLILLPDMGFLVLPESYPVQSYLNELTMQLVIIIICFFMAKKLKISNNAYENEMLLKRTKYHIGPGLAQANYRFLENVIKGKHKSGGNIQLMREYYIEKEDLDQDGSNWFCPKVLILFPEWRKENRERIWGSVDDIVKKEKENGSNHTLDFEKITYTFKASGGNDRRCELEVLKNRDEQGTWYAILAENRPLNTLYRMVGEPTILFKEEDFNQQFLIYMRELRRLLNEDEGCRGKYEIFHYKDPGSAGKFNFSKEIIKQMKAIRNEDASISISEDNTKKCLEMKENGYIQSDKATDDANLLYIQKALKEGNVGEKESLKEDKKNI